MLDLESVRLFTLAAEYGNLTRAAEAAGTVQPVVSQRIKSLESLLGRRLLDRTPRFVRLTDAGADFLQRAHALLAAHQAALAPCDGPPPHIRIGISDHAIGGGFDLLLKRVSGALPANSTIAVSLGQSAAMRAQYEAGAVDFAIIRREVGNDGEVLGKDALEWCAPSGWRRPEGPLPLIMLPPPCGVRAVTIRTLERAGIAWREAFVGGSCLTLVAAVRAGFGVSPLGRMVRRGLDFSAITPDLPALPSSEIAMLARTPDTYRAAAGRALVASVRDMLG
ncbi:DNA-binding transcriptional LysR family regulator [Sphingomonas sp. UYAg733]